MDFACKTLSLDEVVKCSLGLTKGDYKVFQFFLKNQEWYKSNSIAKKLKLNLSTVQRSVKKLQEKGVLTRAQENLDGGGYVYSYKIKGKKEIQKILSEIIDSWTGRVKSELEKI